MRQEKSRELQVSTAREAGQTASRPACGTFTTCCLHRAGKWGKERPNPQGRLKGKGEAGPAKTDLHDRKRPLK